MTQLRNSDFSGKPRLVGYGRCEDGRVELQAKDRVTLSRSTKGCAKPAMTTQTGSSVTSIQQRTTTSEQ